MIQVQDFDLLVNNTKINYVLNNDSWYQDYEGNFTSDELESYLVTIGDTYLSNLTIETAVINIVNVTDDFSTLQKLIDNANGTLTLDKNYTYNPLTDRYVMTVGINKNITIDGAGFTLDAKNQNKIFYVYSDNVTIKNLTFINGDSYAGGAISWSGNCGLLVDCTFINNTADWGGAVEWEGDNGTVSNCIFLNNSASELGGAIEFDGAENCEVLDCLFINNHARNAGAICDDAGDYLHVSGSKFINNSADYYGGAVLCEYCDGADISDCSFITNFAGKSSGAIDFTDCDYAVVSYCNFTNNSANVDGGAIEWWGDNGEVSNCNFEDNRATYGGAVYLWGENDNISNCNFANNSAVNGSAIYGYKGDAVISNSNFTANTAANGGAIYSNINLTVIESQFNNNRAENAGGAIFTSENLTVINSTFANNSAEDGSNDIATVNDANVTLINVSPENLTVLAHVDITALVNDVKYGSDVEIYVIVRKDSRNLDEGLVFIQINNSTYSANVVNGSAIIKIPNLDVGDYDNLKVIFNGSSKYANSFDVVSFSVLKQNTTVTAAAKSYVINYGGKYSVTLKDENGTVIAGKTVTLTINGKQYKATSNAKGVATFTLTKAMLKSAGVKKATIKFAGDNNYVGSTATAKITVKKEAVKILKAKKTYKFKKSKKTKNIKVTLKNSKNKAMKKVKVTLKLSGKKIKGKKKITAKTNKKGVVKFKLGKKLTKKTKVKYKITYKGNAYYKKVTKKGKIKVK